MANTMYGFIKSNEELQSLRENRDKKQALPDGWYTVEINNYEWRQQRKTPVDYLLVSFKVVDLEYGGYWLNKPFYVNSKSIWAATNALLDFEDLVEAAGGNIQAIKKKDCLDSILGKEIEVQTRLPKETDKGYEENDYKHKPVVVRMRVVEQISDIPW